MNDREKIEIYKKHIELFLGTVGIAKSDTIINTNPDTNAKNKVFILKKMTEFNIDNSSKELMSIAIDELLPYLREID